MIRKNTHKFHLRNTIDIDQYWSIQVDVVFNVYIGANMSPGVCRKGEPTFLSSENDVVLAFLHQWLICYNEKIENVRNPSLKGLGSWTDFFPIQNWKSVSKATIWTRFINFHEWKIYTRISLDIITIAFVHAQRG